MKLHTSLHKDFNKKKELVSKNGDVKFNNKKTNIDAKGKKKSSQKWLRRQVNDPFANAAKMEGYLARSAYKLLEINNKYDIFRDKKTIIDLGCTPGSWSQVILTSKNLQNKQVIGVDLLPVKFEHKNLYFIQGDFEDKNVQKEIVEKLKEITKNEKSKKADCIISDIALNNIGNAEIDRMRSERIIELELLFCEKYLSKNGNFVCKALKGADNSVFFTIKNMFEKVYRFKPKSSRKDSSEIFLVALGKK